MNMLEKIRNKFMGNPVLRRLWQIVRIPLAIILVLFVGLVIYRIPVVMERQKTEEVVEKIHSQKLTLADVSGERLPPEPDPVLKDATIEGIDANNNGIRDDVELVIFKLHPDSARIRAAELQYALALQMYLINVFNSETLVAAIQQENRGFFCVADATTDKSPDAQSKEVENLVFNTAAREKKYKDIFDNYMTSYKSLQGSHCDVELKSLPN